MTDSAPTPYNPNDIAKPALVKLFDEQRAYINSFFRDVDYDEIEAFTQLCLGCEGMIFFTGVGKSGFIAQKISMTLVSTGTKSLFLNPIDALHGDIGICGPEDILVLFSKSGNTDEPLNLIPFAKAKGCKLVGVSCYGTSSLAKVCDMHVTLPLNKELCPFNLAPTTSTVVQMLFGDTVAVSLMDRKGLTKEAYAMNHPAGRIGKRLVLKLRDVMVPFENLPVCELHENGLNALVRLANSSKGCGCLLVVDQNKKLLGTFSDGDLRRALTKAADKEAKEQILKAAVGQLMNYMKSYPVTITVAPEFGMDPMAVEALQVMETASVPISYLPIVDAKKTLLGLVTLHEMVELGL